MTLKARATIISDESMKVLAKAGATILISEDLVNPFKVEFPEGSITRQSGGKVGYAAPNGAILIHRKVAGTEEGVPTLMELKVLLPGSSR